MVKGRRRNLHLSARSHGPVQRDERLKGLLLDFEEADFFFFGETLSFLQELPQGLILLSRPVAGPGEIKPHLKVPIILVGEPAAELFQTKLRGLQPPFLQELPEPRVRFHHRLPVAHEKIGQDELPILRGEFFGRLKAELQEEVLCFFGGIVVQLPDEGRNEVEGLPDARVILQQGDHVVISLEGVKTHPGEGILPGQGVPVIGLMHVPEKSDVKHNYL